MSTTSLLSTAARKANVLGAYVPHDLEHWRDKRILLVDDVLTTGATLEECIRVLLTAGAESVQCIVLAETPEHEVRGK